MASLTPTTLLEIIHPVPGSFAGHKHAPNLPPSLQNTCKENLYMGFMRKKQRVLVPPADNDISYSPLIQLSRGPSTSRQCIKEGARWLQLFVSSHKWLVLGEEKLLTYVPLR